MANAYKPNNKRDFTPADVEKLRGSFQMEYTLAKMGAARLRMLLAERPFVRTLGALTGNQAMQQVKAGLEAIYLSGWQVARRREQRRPDVPGPVRSIRLPPCRTW